MNCAPELFESFAELIAIPPVSSIDPRLDQGNRKAIELLAGWAIIQPFISHRCLWYRGPLFELHGYGDGHIGPG